MTEQIAPLSTESPPAGAGPSPAGGGESESAAAAPTPVDHGQNGVLLEIRHLKTYFPILGGIFRRKMGDVYAVDDVSLSVNRGETLGLVGESGCGKTTLGRSVLRLTEPTGGQVVFDGIDVSTLKGDRLRRMRRRMQIVFQDPMSSLNPRMPISDIIGEGLLAQADKENGWSKSDARIKRVGDSLEAVGLRREYSRRYPHEFSGGQRQRIGIARALALQPDFIVCDEPVSALDVSIQSQVLNLLLDLREEFGLTYLFIAHNLSVVEYVSDRVGVMYLGKLAELAGVETIYRDPRHPYTIALLSAIPDPDPRVRKKRLVLKGDVPSPAAPPSGCRFHTRCWLREQLGNPENCATEEPPFREFAPGHLVACHWSEQISASTVAQAALQTPAVVISDVFEDEEPPVAPLPGPADALGPDSPQSPAGP